MQFSLHQTRESFSICCQSPLCHHKLNSWFPSFLQGLISKTLQRWLSIQQVLPSLQMTFVTLKVTFGFFLTSLTMDLLSWMPNLARWLEGSKWATGNFLEFMDSFVSWQCIENCGPLYILMCALSNYVQSIQIATDRLQFSSIQISSIIKAKRMHLTTNCSVMAKGLNAFLNKRFSVYDEHILENL